MVAGNGGAFAAVIRSDHCGLPRGDVAALAAAIQALSTLAASDVTEAEINPLIIKPEGQGVVALDGLLLRMGD
jgi:succinyl-CoA synthetase beta subunit